MDTDNHIHASFIDRMASWPRAYGAPAGRGQVRVQPEDFQVEEAVRFSPDGEGEHVVLQIWKRNSNTEWVARQLAAHAGVRPMDIGYAGLKDRAAVTVQWFSVYLPGGNIPQWQELESEDLKILQTHRHGRKIRRGALSGNHFRIVVRGVEGEHSVLDRRLEHLRAHGVPNYFGDQRFGHNGHNLEQAYALFSGAARKVGRHKRSLYLSAARSFVFNEVLAWRIAKGIWDHAVAGDVMMLAGSRSVFVAEEVDAELERRISELDVHPTGPMWGKGESMARLEAAVVEQAAVENHKMWLDGLESAGMKQQRRALRVGVNKLQWQWPEDGVLILEFSLPPGGYATAVLRELVDYHVPG